MAMSWSSIAKPAEGAPSVISIATHKYTRPVDKEPEQPSVEFEQDEATPEASSSAAEPAQDAEEEGRKTIRHLILDAGPLLSLAPLRDLATSFHTTPQVFAELKDLKAREHWERLGLTGVDVKIEPPTAEAMAKVSAFARKTGDYAVLSQTDLSVAALTYQYEVLLHGDSKIRTEPKQKKTGGGGGNGKGKEKEAPKKVEVAEAKKEEEEKPVEVEKLAEAVEQVTLEPTSSEAPSTTPVPESAPAQADDAEDDEDAGDWINPANLTVHRSRDLGLITPSGSTAKPPAVACMTGDYAVQNILLGMGLGLVGEGGKKISKVKSFVLRCHACFKICKDSSKRFCPSCGNASLIRTTVSTSAKTGEQIIHLKQNFQYRTRGTIYSIPDAKMGRAKGQQKGGSGLILREDQREWQDAEKGERIRRDKEERKAAKGALEGWNDPDWMPEILSVGMNGKGRSSGRDMPNIGHGRKNPNQGKRRR
ncbi:RNA-binding protein NOB1 [Cryptococcus wingfieldii CBS 7118]|uniref:20S-pre-rRNA D-site endonuclease NOB1 n=1 Tax=Cryptococcus wingfieldii CBS 7118 TaxID=1295528 RepID=A0A1E3IM52_9TREE|nr:RNA-binding protein NOB1 [Cryptococcus wingfieldii CBS 7118]ODN89683.1 RNA-binding protein NOB1 [Cryptococcus wingfieldii CBS 7118]